MIPLGHRRGLSVRVALLAMTASLSPASAPAASSAACPEGMALVGVGTCVDRWEASLEVLDSAGLPRGLHPHNREIAGATVRAVSRPGVFPQAHVSRDEAAAACEKATKRLCTDDEWLAACRGATPSRWPYGARFRAGACNDEGVSPLRLLHGTTYAHDHATMNDPRLDLVAGSVARTGHFARCTSGNGVFDMVGNVHEWTAPAGPSGGGRAVFRGGYFLETKALGEGCDYETAGHFAGYRDYSTGFRCCADPR